MTAERPTPNFQRPAPIQTPSASCPAPNAKRRTPNVLRFLPFLFLIIILHSGFTKEEPGSSGPPPSAEQAEELTFSQSSSNIESYDFVEVTINVAGSRARNPFTDVTVSGHFAQLNQQPDVVVSGFCDSPDGAVFRIRFMPSKAGDYIYSVKYQHGNFARQYDGKFTAVDGKRSGVLRVDADYPWHFIWEGSGQHYFLNGTTAFFLMGWDSEQVIRDCINRLHTLGVNRMRILLDGRTDHFWTEPIKPGNGFRAYVNPWVAAGTDYVSDPRFDYTRFNCSYWQKFERMLNFARQKDMIISVVFGTNDTPVHPAAGSPDERRYFEYSSSRLSAFANVTWDLGDDLDGFRSDAWTHETGTMLYGLDPYHHLATSHPVRNQYQDRKSQWFTMTSFQWWVRPQHAWMLTQRQEQIKAGRIIPQVNEEYGYEDHYPTWAPYKPPAASPDNDRRTAWEMSMAGCYQTTGETAKRGTGVPPDTGGGWVNGRGDATMTMLNGYAYMVHFFTSFDWWKSEPHDELVSNGAFCLAEIGNLYVAYLPHGGHLSIKLEAGRYKVKWFNPRDGQYSAVGVAEGPVWHSPAAANNLDWVLLLTKARSEN